MMLTIDRRDPARCHQNVFDQYHHHQCLRRGVVEEDGKRWCRQHLPSAVKARRKAEDRKWREESDRRSLLERTEEELIEAVLEADERTLPFALWQVRQKYKEARE